MYHISPEQRQDGGERHGLCLEGGHHGGDRLGVQDCGGDGLGSEDDPVALCLGVSEDSGQGDGVCDDGGGGLEGVGEGAGHLAVLRHGGDQRLQQSCLECGVALQQPDGAGEVASLRPHHGGGDSHHLGPGEQVELVLYGWRDFGWLYLVVVDNAEFYREE